MEICLYILINLDIGEKTPKKITLILPHKFKK